MNQTYIEDEEGDHSQKNIVNSVHYYEAVIDTVEWTEDEGEKGAHGPRPRFGNTHNDQSLRSSPRYENLKFGLL